MPSTLRDLGSGVLVPAEFECAFEYEEDHTVRMRITVDDRGHAACDELCIVRHPRKPPLSGTELRRLNVREHVEYAVASKSVVGKQRDDGTTVITVPSGANEERVANAAERAVRRRTLTPEFLREVAAIAERVSPDDRAAEISDVYDVSIQTAYRWLKKAKLRSEGDER